MEFVKQSDLVRELQTAVLGLAVLLGIGSAAHAQAVEPGAYGRVRFADQGGTILRTDGEASESDRAIVNAPLFPGDLLRTDSGQQVDVQLAGGSMIRVDGETDIVFQSLPNPTAAFRDNIILVLKSGVIGITSRVGEHEVFRIDTAEAAVYLNGEGEIRVAARPREGTRVTSFRGVAEVVGSDSPVLVRGGMSIGLSGWRASRDDASRANDRELDARDEVPEEVRPYYGGLVAPGRLDVEAKHSVAWSPTVVSAGWRSYYVGNGYYRPISSDIWDSDEALAPYSYCGYAWTGTRPPWGYAQLYAGYYDPSCAALIYYKRLESPEVIRYEFPIDQISYNARGTTVASRAPSVDPRHVGRSVKGDRAAHLDVQDQLMKRGSRGSEIVRNPRAAQPPAAVEPRATAPRHGRSLEAPRRHDASVARPAQPRVDAPRREASMQHVQPRQAPQAQAPRSQPQQSQPQRPQPQQGQGGSGGRSNGGKR